MHEQTCDPITQNTTCNDIGRKMEAEIDACPPDECSETVKNDSLAGKPSREDGCHHKGIEGMSTGKAGVDNFSWAMRQSGKGLHKNKGSFSVDEKFESVNHAGLDAVKKKERTEGLSLSDEKKRKNDEDNHSNMASEMSDPGNRSIQKR